MKIGGYEVNSEPAPLGKYGNNVPLVRLTIDGGWVKKDLFADLPQARKFARDLLQAADDAEGIACTGNP